MQRTIVAVATICLLGGAFTANAAVVAHWTLDEGAGSVAADSSGNDYHGSLNNFEGDEWITTGLAPVPGGTTAALRFDGNGAGNQEYVKADGTATGAVGYKGILGDAERTVSAWIKVPSTGNPNGEILSWGQDDAQTHKWIFRVQNTNGQEGAIRV